MKNMYIFPLLILLSLICYIICIQCVGHNQQPLDWYVMMKIPMQPGHRTKNKLIDGGVAYKYITSQNQTAWILSDISINTTESILGQTLSLLYANPIDKDSMFLLYNDEPRNKNANAKKGHTKGVLMANESGGFWLIHSVPLFPPTPDEGQYSYPTSGRNFGQSILCLSLDLDQINEVGFLMKYNAPDLYAKFLPYSLTARLPNIADVFAGRLVNSPPWFSSRTIKTLAGVELLAFAKTRDFNYELYEDFVAPSLKANLDVQTWPNGPGRLPSNCSRFYEVHNVQASRVDEVGLQYSSTTDHSKWAVSSTDWVCIGDINRAEHQKFRGGGTVCMLSRQLARNYNQTIATMEDCTIIATATYDNHIQLVISKQ